MRQGMFKDESGFELLVYRYDNDDDDDNNGEGGGPCIFTIWIWDACDPV